jgi:hypothetical protein
MGKYFQNSICNNLIIKPTFDGKTLQFACFGVFGVDSINNILSQFFM